MQKQPSRGVLRKRFSENMRQIYRRTPMPKCDFKKLQRNFFDIKLRHGCSPVNLQHIFRTPFHKNTSGRLLLQMATPKRQQINIQSEKDTRIIKNHGKYENNAKVVRNRVT